jgi:hypothetical protein
LRKDLQLCLYRSSNSLRCNSTKSTNNLQPWASHCVLSIRSDTSAYWWSWIKCYNFITSAENQRAK